MANQTMRQKLKRRITPDQLDKLLELLTTEQGGRCACCGHSVSLAIEWVVGQEDDTGMPQLRAAICRSCKIAVNRVLEPSRFTLTPEKLQLVEVYLLRRIEGPNDVFRRHGLTAIGRNQVVHQAPPSQVETRLSRTDDILAWVEGLGRDGAPAPDTASGAGAP